MKIREFCMFYNEHAALAIKLGEGASWVDEVHMCESSRTFQNTPHTPSLNAEQLPVADGAQSHNLLHAHVFDGAHRFYPARKWGPSRYFPFFRKKSMARHNETMQRNHVHEVFADIADDDIIILSDSDEILDSRRADELIASTRKHGLISVRLHHTLFYLNLYSQNWHEVWPGSPPDYACRVFLMTGARFHALRQGSDRLRRLGEWGRLAGKVPLLDGFGGFHHSWLGDTQAAAAKLQSYAHSADEHRQDLLDDEGRLSLNKLGALIHQGQSLFDGHRLEIRDFQQQPPLRHVAEHEQQARLSGLILDER